MRSGGTWRKGRKRDSGKGLRALVSPARRLASSPARGEAVEDSHSPAAGLQEAVPHLQGCHAEVGDADVVLLIQQQVLWLQVSVTMTDRWASALDTPGKPALTQSVPLKVTYF